MAFMYSLTQFQAIPTSGFPQQVNCFRWYPHLAGALLCPFAQSLEVLRAHRAFQEIADRDTH